MDGKDEFRPSFVKPNPKQTQRTKGSKQRKNANQLKLTFYLMLGKTRVTKSQLLLALNLVGLEEVGTSKSEIVQFSFECLICVDSAIPVNNIYIVFKLDEILSERTGMIYGRKYGKIFHKLNNF